MFIKNSTGGVKKKDGVKKERGIEFRCKENVPGQSKKFDRQNNTIKIFCKILIYFFRKKDNNNLKNNFK